MRRNAPASSILSVERERGVLSLISFGSFLGLSPSLESPGGGTSVLKRCEMKGKGGNAAKILFWKE